MTPILQILCIPPPILPMKEQSLKLFLSLRTDFNLNFGRASPSRIRRIGGS